MRKLKTNCIPENWFGTLNIGTVSEVLTPVLIGIERPGTIRKNYATTTGPSGELTLAIAAADPYFSKDAGQYRVSVITGNFEELPITIDGTAYTCLEICFCLPIDCNTQRAEQTITLAAASSDCDDCN